MVSKNWDQNSYFSSLNICLNNNTTIALISEPGKRRKCRKTNCKKTYFLCNQCQNPTCKKCFYQNSKLGFVKCNLKKEFLMTNIQSLSVFLTFVVQSKMAKLCVITYVSLFEIGDVQCQLHLNAFLRYAITI